MHLLLLAIVFAATASGQRITTIQLDGVQYFISRMNPYSPELNYFLAYQYCRSLGLQLASFESREKADSLMEYLRNAGYNKYDFWTSGNRLGTSDMMLWMSTGLPFNSTFNYMRNLPSNDLHSASEDQDAASDDGGVVNEGVVEGRSKSNRRRRGGYHNPNTGCVTLKAPELSWETDDCNAVKDFICEQTRCYYYNYGSIPVSTSQGSSKYPSGSKYPSASGQQTSTTAAPTTTSTTPVTTEKSSESPSTTPARGKDLDKTNRRVTLRPPSEKSAPLPLSSIFPDLMPSPRSSENKSIPNIVTKAFPRKDSDSNVVYVTAVGVNSEEPVPVNKYTEPSNTAAPMTTRDNDESKVTAQMTGPKTFARGKVIDPPTAK
ncbi:uncharacterized protein LOC126272350 isoform X1 [Schistocerca gregaria]|uniref:uncharacterized protein LOC126272350 isoform X1 n=2 Tax=Schistocerca gregaria TaxID=7010 RepID=UPI00211F46A2|nr:uncharacterized protein LOC126272350 isoform X1 [Schistocerca gregaria]